MNIILLIACHYADNTYCKAPAGWLRHYCGDYCLGATFCVKHCVIAVEKQEGLAFAGRKSQDFANNDVMITTIMNLMGSALEAGQRAGD